MAITLDGNLGITTPAETVQGALTTTGNTILGDATTDTLTVGVTGIVKDASGNVGIGTASPAQKLHVVQATDANTDGIRVARTGNATQYGSLSNYGGATWLTTVDTLAGGNNITVFNRSSNGTTFTESMRIDSSGNVGIGTASPSSYGSPLSVYAATNPTLSIASGNANAYLRLFSTSDNNMYLTNTGGAMTMIAANTERMRIDSSGNLLVGTLVEPFGSSPGIALLNTPTVAGRLQIGVNQSSAYNVAQFYNTNGLIGSISLAGGATSYVTSSDYRLKENIAPMTGALATVSQLKPVTYSWKADSSDGQGFIAHELQAVVPDCVTGEKDAVDAEGKAVHQGVDTSFLVATLTAAIQELKAIVDAQAVRIAALES